MSRPRFLPLLVLAVGLSAAVGVSQGQPPQPAQPPVLAPIDANAATALPVVPKSTAAFLSIKLSDVIDHPDFKPLFAELKKSPDAVEGLSQLFGVGLDEIDRVTLFWPAISQRGPEPVVVVTTREAFNEVRLLKALNARPVSERGFGHGFGHDDHGHFHEDAHVKPSVNSTVDVLEKPAEKAPPPPFPPVPVPPKECDAQDPCANAPLADGPTEPQIYELQGSPFDLLFMVDERTLVFLSASGPSHDMLMLSLVSQLLQKKQTSPLADAIATATKHTLAGGVYLPPLLRDLQPPFLREMPPELAPYAALLATRTGVITGDMGKPAKATLTLSFDTEAAARRAAPVLEEGLKELSAKAIEEATRMKGRKGPDAALSPLFEIAATGMKKATVKAEGTLVRATTEIDVGPAAATALANLFQGMGERKKFVESTNNLKQIGIALHSYHDANGHLPMNVYSPKGEPLLSWRVQLLPFLEQDALYRQFKMDEPWDGPNNKKLSELVLKVFQVPGREAPNGHTYFQAFISPDPAKGKGVRPPGFPQPGIPGQPAPFMGRSWLVEGGKVRTNLVQIPDGTSNTIGVVEARTSVIWSKPDDLPFGEKLPALGDPNWDRFAALFLDGSVRSLPTRLKPEVLRLLIDIQDGTPVPNNLEEAVDRNPPKK